jgi:exopolysaccharide biosynthesis polyprenyl glycosylphosphotransferase
VELIGHEETELLTSALTVPVVSEQRWRFLARPVVKRSLFLLGDVLALILAHNAASGLVTFLFRVPHEALDPIRYWVFFVPFFAAVLYLFDAYGTADLRRPERELELSFKAVSFSFLGLLAANSVFYRGLVFSRYLILTWYLLAVACVLCARFLLRMSYGALWQNGLARSRALLIGPPDKILRYQQLLTLQRHHIYDIVGVISPNGRQNSGLEAADLPVLGNLEHWEEVVRHQRVQLIVLNLPHSEGAHDIVLHVISKCRDLHVGVEIFADMFSPHELKYEFDYFTGCFRFSSKPLWSRVLQRFSKWVIDVVFGLIGSLLTLLITPLIALLINLEDRGPVFHRREFVGGDGEIRHYLKFRTMVRDADQILQNDSNLKASFLANCKLREDPRILRVGRFLRKYSIDEFPQFFRLLAGQLTLVGPRVIANEEKGRYGDLLPKRLSVKPGITGYWQVMGRQKTTYDERIQMDMFYIDHWSIWLDLFIIAKTFGKIIWPEGAY